MHRLLRFLIRYPVLQVAVIVLGLLAWAETGLLDPRLARADGACGHFCADNFSTGGEAVCSFCGCAAGAGFVRCPEEVTCGDLNKCVYCCVGCVPPPGAPPGANEGKEPLPFFPLASCFLILP